MGVVGVKAHDGGRECRGEAGRDDHCAMIHAGFLEHRRDDEHDVGHREEGGGAGPQLRRHAGAGGTEAEVAVELGREARWLSRFFRFAVPCQFIDHSLSPQPLSSPGLTGRSSTPLRICVYWMPAFAGMTTPRMKVIHTSGIDERSDHGHLRARR